MFITKKNSLFILYLVFLMTFFYSLLAQDLIPKKIQIYTTADGLRDNSILCIDQDNEGNLWIGHRNGVSKFDGKTFTNYDEDKGFNCRKVWVVLCDSNGFIWFGTEGDGLFRYKGNTWEQFTKEEHGVPTNDFFDGFLYEDSQGNIWGGKQNCKTFKFSNNEFTLINFKGRDLVENKNEIYAISSSYFYKFSTINNIFEQINKLSDMPKNLLFDNDSNLWISFDTYLNKSIDKGIFFEKNDDYPIEENSRHNICWDTFIDETNQIWIGSINYIIRFDGSNFYTYDADDGLPRGHYKYIFQDKQGHLWFCSSYGLAKFDNIPPLLSMQTSILPQIVESRNIAIQFSGDDGQFGSPTEELKYQPKYLK